MKTMLSRFWLIAAAVCLMATAGPVCAQVDKGRISGVVQDPSHSSVKGAMVEATNDRTGETKTTETNEEGAYVISPLTPSFYSVKVSAAGFSPTQVTNLQVAVGQDLHQNITLQIGSISAQVTVTAVDEVPIDTTSARIGLNVTQREVVGLPLNGRQVSQLFLQAPGATNAGTGTFQDIRFSGQATEENAIRYDGIEGSALVDAAPGNLNGETPSPFRLQSSLENVQEFRVESNNYPAEYGTGDGGQISVVTKSGSNQFHGSGYEYLRNDALDAKNFFDPGTQKSKLRLNQFGGSIGGPIIKNKAFFFGYYEGYRLSAGVNNIESVPSHNITGINGNNFNGTSGPLPACTGAQSFPTTACVSSNVAALFPGFLDPHAVLIKKDPQGAALGNNSLDAYLLQGLFAVQENSFGGRFDYRVNDKNSFYIRFFRDQGKNDYPEGVTGRHVFIRSVPQNGAAAITTTLTPNVINEAKIGFNYALSRINGTAPVVNGIDFSKIAINATGGIANPGIAGQGNSTGLAVPGGLVRQNSAANGTGAPYTPYSVSFLDNVSWSRGSHNLKFGVEVRLIRMYTDRLGGTTYSFSNLSSLMNAALSSADDLVDVNAPSPYNAGVTGNRLLKQEYYIGYVQDEVKLRPNLTLNAGLRYEYYTPLREANDEYILFNLNTGTMSSPNFCLNPGISLQTVCKPQSADWYHSSPNNFGPRIGLAWSPFYSHSGIFSGDRTVLRAGFGIYYGPGQTEDQLQPAESDRIWTTPSGGNSSLPLANPSLALYCGQAATCATSTANLTANFLNPANVYNRAARVRAYAPDYTIPERIYQYSVSWQQQWGKFVSTVAYVGSQGRNLFLRNVGNTIVSVRTNTANGGAIPVRQFDIDCNGVTPVAGTPTSACPSSAAAAVNTVLHPYAEIDYKTSGGYDSYNALQTQLLRRFGNGLSLSAQYTWSRNFGDSGGSNESLTAGNLFDYNGDRGYNSFDVRNNFNVSALYTLPFGRSEHGIVGEVIGNWTLGTIVNARSGLPVPVQITRPDTVFRGLPGTSIAGKIFGSAVTGTAAACPGFGAVPATICTEAIINTPGGGNSRNVRRPDIVPGQPFFLPNGNLNPGAFAVPQPGTYGNMMRGSVRGPALTQADLIVVKKFPIHEAISAEFRAEVFNIFNHPNFANPPAQLGNVLPGSAAALGAANTLQPGQAYTSATQGSFGPLTSTVGTTVGIGTNRQIQFAVRLNF